MRLLRGSKSRLHGEESCSVIDDLKIKSKSVLEILEAHLADQEWIAGTAVSIADYALFPYTQWIEEVGFSKEEWPAVNRWLCRFEQVPGFLPPYTEGAREVIEFEAYFKSTPAGKK